MKKSPLRLPGWARPGAFNGALIFGGRMEAAKHGLGKHMPQPLDLQELEKACSDPASSFPYVYYRAYDDARLVERLQDVAAAAGKVVFSVGFAETTEAAHRKIVARMAADMKARGLHPIFYLSLTNLFRYDMFEKMPESQKFAQRLSQGELVPYGTLKPVTQKTVRVLACVRHPQWKALVLRRVDEALAAGAEGIDFDNLFTHCRCEAVCRPAFRQFMKERVGEEIDPPRVLYLGDEDKPEDSEVGAQLPQRESEREYAIRLYWADFSYRGMAELCLEVARHIAQTSSEFYFAANAHQRAHLQLPLNALATEDSCEPGLKDGKPVVNLGMWRYMRDYCQLAGKTFTAIHGRRLEGTRGTRGMPEEAHVLSAFEIAACEGNFCQNAEDHTHLRRLTDETFSAGLGETYLQGLWRGDEDHVRFWKNLGQVYKYVKAHPELFTALEEVCPLGLLIDMGDWGHPRNQLMHALGQRDIPFRALPLELFEGAECLAQMRQYPVVLAAGLVFLGERLVADFKAYVREGGTLVLIESRPLKEGTLSELKLFGLGPELGWDRSERPGETRQAELGKGRLLYLPHTLSEIMDEGKSGGPDALAELLRALGCGNAAEVVSSEGSRIPHLFCVANRRGKTVVVHVLNYGRQAEEGARLSLAPAVAGLSLAQGLPKAWIFSHEWDKPAARPARQENGRLSCALPPFRHHAAVLLA